MWTLGFMLARQLWQLGDIRRYAPGFVALKSPAVF